MRAAVVGAGIAGTACARVLTEAGHDVRVLDRGRIPGGRLASRRLHGRPVDLGASYFTVSDDRFGAVVEGWGERGLARPWTDAFDIATPAGRGGRKQGPVRYATPGGLRTLVEDLAAGLRVESGTEVGTVGPGASVDGRPYDVVVLAMPDPQALRVLDPALTAARDAIGGRPWQPVLSVAAGWDRRTWDLDGCFVHDSPDLEWLADDGSRRGDGAPVLVAHSTPGLAARHLSDPEAGAAPVLAALREVLDLPAPAWSYVQRWTYAKPVGTRDAPYGLFDGVGLCGDGWGASKVEAAWVSGDALGRALA